MPGDAGRGVALGGEDAIAFAVVLEGLLGAVRPAPVELDRDLAVLPEAVDLVEAVPDREVGVHARPRQAETVDQGQERLLELVARDPHRRASPLARRASSTVARAPG